ncbi:hypothetical protein JBE27_25760, partial [Streptomyces albiflaviniger]|nr:hypothetical protein [Streptomyces albiflaviniger]
MTPQGHASGPEPAAEPATETTAQPPHLRRLPHHEERDALADREDLAESASTPTSPTTR